MGALPQTIPVSGLVVSPASGKYKRIAYSRSGDDGQSVFILLFHDLPFSVLNHFPLAIPTRLYPFLDLQCSLLSQSFSSLRHGLRVEEA